MVALLRACNTSFRDISKFHTFFFDTCITVCRETRQACFCVSNHIRAAATKHHNSLSSSAATNTATAVTTIYTTIWHTSSNMELHKAVPPPLGRKR